MRANALRPLRTRQRQSRRRRLRYRENLTRLAGSGQVPKFSAIRGERWITFGDYGILGTNPLRASGLGRTCAVAVATLFVILESLTEAEPTVAVISRLRLKPGMTWMMKFASCPALKGSLMAQVTTPLFTVHAPGN